MWSTHRECVKANRQLYNHMQIHYIKATLRSAS